MKQESDTVAGQRHGVLVSITHGEEPIETMMPPANHPGKRFRSRSHTAKSRLKPFDHFPDLSRAGASRSHTEKSRLKLLRLWWTRDRLESRSHTAKSRLKLYERSDAALLNRIESRSHTAKSRLKHSEISLLQRQNEI